METLVLIGTITLVHLLAVISPGPDFVVAVKNSLSYSRRTGIYTAVGFGLGIAVHIAYCLAGIALVISQSVVLFNIIKFIGAAYLIYIGAQALFSQSTKTKINVTEKQPDISPFKAMRIGFLTNVLNPKATLFFLSLFTLVITPNTPATVLAVVSVVMIVNTTLWFALVAVFLTNPVVRAQFLRFQNMFDSVFGGILMVLGVKVALSQK